MDSNELPIQVKCAHRKMVKIGLLTPHPKTPNVHPERQILLLAKLVRYHGWRAPITVSNQSGYIVRGHARYLAAKALGVEEVPVDYQDYVSDVDELADLYADNKIAELSAIDRGLENDLLAEFKAADFDIENAGISAKEAAKHIWVPDSSVLDGAPGTSASGSAEGGADAAGGQGEGETGDAWPQTKHECPKCGFKW